MIQALALELLWSHLRESSSLWTPGWDAVVGWIQVGTMMLGFLQVWIFYISLVMRFSWVPSIGDATVPFAIGILEFGLIDLMGPDTLGPWFYTLALVFSVSLAASHAIFKRARRDPANREFFASLPPATIQDYIPSLGSIAGIFLLGLILHVSGNRSWLALGAIVIAAAAIAHQLEMTRRYWELSMTEPSSPEAAT
jgi:hypothetical protein